MSEVEGFRFMSRSGRRSSSTDLSLDYQLRGSSMKILQKIVSGILISLVFGAVGFFVAWLIMRGVENGVFTQWQPLGIPSEGAEIFVSYQFDSGRDSNNVYVETLSGKLFLYHTDSKTWQETTDFPSDQGMASECNLSIASMQNTISKLPHPAKDCIEKVWSWEWATDTDIFVIITDGSVWKWRDYTSLGLGFGITCGSPVLAIIIGWGTVWAFRRKGKKSNDK